MSEALQQVQIMEQINNHLSSGAVVNNRDAFVPPNPKEFDRATLTGISLETVNGMKESLKTGSGIVKLSVKGAIPCNKMHHKS